VGKVILKDAHIEINSVDLSDRANQVAIEAPTDDVDLSCFGGDYHEHGQGLKDATITVTFIQDFDAAQVDATLWPLHESGESFPVAVRPFSDPVAADNPEFGLEAILMNYSPLSASHGEAATTDVSFVNASQAGLTRDDTP
jgi:hypothetical protein